MRFRQSNIAFDKDDTNRFLPWLIAFMALLAALSVAGFLVLKQISENFKYSNQNSMTVQIPAGENSKIDEENASKIQITLRSIEGVLEAKRISHAEIKKLLQPWLGGAVGSKAIPLPQIIDVKINRESKLTARKLVDLLTQIMPGTTVDDHSFWITSLVETLQSAELIALVIVFLITLATIGTVTFTTRTGMGIHKQTIEVLHFVGAHDSFIARQFAIRAFLVGLQGGTGGVLLAAPILYVSEYILTQLETGLLPKASLNISVWLGVSLVVPIVAIVAMITAQSTVIKTLKKMV